MSFFQKTAMIIALLAALVFAPVWLVMLKNQLKLNEFESQFNGFEQQFSLQGTMVSKDKRVTLDHGSGNYCLFLAERNYKFVASEKIRDKMGFYEFSSIATRADGLGAKVIVLQYGLNLKVQIQDGPWDNNFDLRCG